MLTVEVWPFEGNDYVITVRSEGGRLSEAKVIGPPLFVNEARLVRRWLVDGGLADISDELAKHYGPG